MSLPGSAGNIAFVSLLFTPTGIHSPWRIQTRGFTVHSHFMKRECKALLCPWETDPVGWREGWSWDSEELDREEILYWILSYRFSSLLCRTCCLVIVQLLFSLPFPTLSMHKAK